MGLKMAVTAAALSLLLLLTAGLCHGVSGNGNELNIHMKDGDNGAVDTEQETTVNGANNGRINGGSEGGGNNSDNLANEEQPSNSSSDIAPDNLTESPE